MATQFEIIEPREIAMTEWIWKHNHSFHYYLCGRNGISWNFFWFCLKGSVCSLCKQIQMWNVVSGLFLIIWTDILIRMQFECRTPAKIGKKGGSNVSLHLVLFTTFFLVVMIWWVTGMGGNLFDMNEYMNRMIQMNSISSTRIRICMLCALYRFTTLCSANIVTYVQCAREV